MVDVPARTAPSRTTTPWADRREGGTAHADLDRVARWLCEDARQKCGATMEAGDWETRDVGEGAPPQHNGW